MKATIFKAWCLTGLLALSAIAAQAQDVVIRRNTTTTTTTTSTTTVSKPKPQPKPTTGTLSITSTPSDAAIKIDGEYMGTTPLTLRNRRSGTYSVTFSAEGYETTTRSITVIAGQTATCNATLKRKQTPQQPSTPAQSVNTSSATSQTITANGVSFKMIRVDGGTFTMGATSEQGSDAFDDEKPTHQVTLSSYYIGETEVTQALWEAVMGTTVSQQRDLANKDWSLYGVGANYPMYYISWEECQTFIRKLNSLTGKSFRLPTEAEWEFAARGGTKSQGYKYSGSNNLSAVAWYDDNSGSGTHPVKTKSPNELGIYDMSGNVFEWCQDWKGAYSSSHQRDPMGASSGSYRVIRGGSWSILASFCRVSIRRNYAPDYRYSYLGLRLVL